jgi:hypothetical protein
MRQPWRGATQRRAARRYSEGDCPTRSAKRVLNVPRLTLADLQADFGDRHFPGFEKPPGTLHSQAGDELVRRLAEGVGEQTLEVERGTGRPGARPPPA